MRPQDSTIENSYVIHDPEAVKEATSRLTKILDAKYKKADLKQVVQDVPELTAQEKAQLLKLLQTYEDLFDGT